MYYVEYTNQNGDKMQKPHNNLQSALNETDLYADKYGTFVALAEIKRNIDDEVVWSSKDAPELKAYLKYDKEQWANLATTNVPCSNKPSIYFDIDGTLGYWYQNTRGFAYPDQVLDPHYHYFKDIEPHEFMIELARNLCVKGYDVCVISSAEKDTIRDKWEWLDNNCPFIDKKNIFFSPLGADKNNFIKGNAEISVLIDDYKVNLEKWKGTPIKAINSINSVDSKMFCIEGYSAEMQRENWDKTMEVSIKKVEECVSIATKNIRKENNRNERI